MTADVYAGKVKTLLVGLPASPAEVSRLQEAPDRLPTLLREWQALPGYRDKMLQFWGSAFQQSQANAEDFAALGVVPPDDAPGHALLQNLRDSFARTVWELLADGQPFTAAFTTRRFMMTPGLMAFYAQLDAPGDAVTLATTSAQLEDYTAWRWVEVVQAAPGESVSPPDVAQLRHSSTLRLQVPRVGFFTTPAFLAQWQTNVSNQARVTLNQTLIVAFNQAVDGTELTLPPQLTALDAAHAPPHTACFACHRTLDPMRQFFRQAYSLSFHRQSDPAMQAMPGMFGWAGVSEVGEGIEHFARLLATSSRVAQGWTQKLCTYATAAPCEAHCPEFERVSQVFADSGFDFHRLVVELFASPIVTYASSTRSALQAGEVVSVARRRHWCGLLASRLGIEDPCQPGVADALPDDAYSRGAIDPVLVTEPDMFFYAGVQQVCAELAPRVVDAGVYDSGQPEAAIASMAQNLMGITTARLAPMTRLLGTHYTACLAAGATPGLALQSTFVVACSSPATVGLGL